MRRALPFLQQQQNPVQGCPAWQLVAGLYKRVYSVAIYKCYMWVEAGRNCLMGHIQYAEHPLNNFLLQTLSVNSTGLSNILKKKKKEIKPTKMGSVALSASCKKGQKKKNLAPGRCAAHACGADTCISASCIPSTLRHMSGISKEEPSWFIFLMVLKAAGDTWWQFSAFLSPVLLSWSHGAHLEQVPALQTWGRFGLEAATVLHMCYGHRHHCLTTAVLKVNPIPFQRKQPPPFELLMSM